MKYLAIVALIAAAVAGSQLLFSFHSWNREQACATGGGRGCAGAQVPLSR